MKRISFLLITLALCAPPVLRGQDAATQERLDKLSGRIEDLVAAQESIKKQLSELAREIESVREQASKPTGNYATREDLNRLAEKVGEVDRKRIEDAEKIRTELLKLRDVFKTQLAPPKKGLAAPPAERSTPEPPAADPNAKVFPYKIQSGDTLDAIVQAYREKNIKVTVAEILKANPGLKAEKLIVGKTIYIPAPKS
jgi:septal ring factor EnvC (AmiA/AmiB activator)